MTFVKELGRCVRAETGEPRSLQFLLQGIYVAVAIQRGNAAAVRGPRPQWTMYLSDFPVFRGTAVLLYPYTYLHIHNELYIVSVLIYYILCYYISELIDFFHSLSCGIPAEYYRDWWNLPYKHYLYLCINACNVVYSCPVCMHAFR